MQTYVTTKNRFKNQVGFRLWQFWSSPMHFLSRQLKAKINCFRVIMKDSCTALYTYGNSFKVFKIFNKWVVTVITGSNARKILVRHVVQCPRGSNLNKSCTLVVQCHYWLGKKRVQITPPHSSPFQCEYSNLDTVLKP